MKYTVSNQTAKTSSTGTNFVQVTLTDETGVNYDKINLFNGEATGKTEIEGDLVQNGQYWNFKSKVTHTANMPTRMASMMQSKNENIEHAQDRKSESIALAGSITNATNLLVAMMNAGITDEKSEDQVKTKLRELVVWYQTMYKNPGVINPSSVDIPF